MFKIYDLNYNELTFPKDKLGYGLRGVDISIGPVIHENIYSQSSYADKLVKRYPKDRNASISILFTSMDTIDWRLKRDRVYAFFRNLGVFYVAESYQPFKLLKVIVDEDYEVDRPVNIWGQSEITLKIIDTPFKKSLHSTQTIETEGLLSNDKWAKGMGLKTSTDTWKYAFINADPYFYNAGTEEVKLIKQKESEIVLTFNGSTLNGLVDIDDGITTFKLFRDVTAGDVLRIKGHQITLNGDNVAGDTNRQFLTVKRGWNSWDVRGVTDFEFKIDYRYLYD